MFSTFTGMGDKKRKLSVAPWKGLEKNVDQTVTFATFNSKFKAQTFLDNWRKLAVMKKVSH